MNARKRGTLLRITVLLQRKSLRAITAGDAHDWRQPMFKDLTSVTIAGHVKRAKQFFTHASRKRFIESNPFA